jgi:hypothetical protein
LSNHQKTILSSFSNTSIKAKQKIAEFENKYKFSKNIITETVPLIVNDSELEKHIGRYVKFDEDEDEVKPGTYYSGTIFEIIAIQKHWGYVNNKYVPNKIGFRLCLVGDDNDFGCVGDVDIVKFVNITEAEAININKKLLPTRYK